MTTTRAIGIGLANTTSASSASQVLWVCSSTCRQMKLGSGPQVVARSRAWVSTRRNLPVQAGETGGTCLLYAWAGSPRLPPMSLQVDPHTEAVPVPVPVEPRACRCPPMAGATALKRKLLGPPLHSDELEHQRLGKPTALAVFASDNLSSSAYATEEILHVLVPAVGIAAFSLVMPITIALLVMLGLLILSYRETIKEYPSAGGAYLVTRDNFGIVPAQVAGVRPAHRLHPHGVGVGVGWHRGARVVVRGPRPHAGAHLRCVHRDRDATATSAA